MVWNKDVHATNIVFNSGTAPVFNGIHDAVDHDLCSEGIIAGHGDHTTLDSFAAGSDALSIFATALGAGAVVCHIDLQGVKGFALCRGSNRLIKVHILGPSQSEGAFVAGRVEYHSGTTG